MPKEIRKIVCPLRCKRMFCAKYVAFTETSLYYETVILPLESSILTSPRLFLQSHSILTTHKTRSNCKARTLKIQTAQSIFHRLLQTQNRKSTLTSPYSCESPSKSIRNPSECSQLDPPSFYFNLSAQTITFYSSHDAYPEFGRNVR